MPFCGDCRNYYPYVQEDDEFKGFLVAAYHDVDCGIRMMLDFEGLLEDMIFDGDVLFEIQDDGTRKPVSTWHGYPAPPTEAEMPVPVEEPRPAPVIPEGAKSYSWAEFRRRWPHYGQSFDKDTTYHERYQSYKSHSGGHDRSYSYTYKAPYEIVDRVRWPNLWRFTVKLHFLPNGHKDTKWVNGAEPIPAVGFAKKEGS